MTTQNATHDPLAPFIIEQGQYHDEGWVVWNPAAKNGWAHRVVVDHKSQAIQHAKALNKRVLDSVILAEATND